ncbi:GTP-binding protein [Paenibacillus sp. CGMCC 1.16610]|uniref:GTP-binding protein n=1 Tax=Paenibacillus anseongense TaxID=2682845 RepID=A0ABW9UKN7_9BACL|nr:MULTISPECIES: CobW family GTP-binding protein [Paenibacillus]MBA2941958.1 GTP-binding protein [Paenibacillus sp. CGMCC 1.16610]MVQ38445.1 GTP-binding protein [Paenibacillus anseongense]
MNKVPVIILSGFLGSGKTTLLLRMLREAAAYHLMPAVLMNELGKQDVDGHLLLDVSPHLPLAKLLDGCICCTKKSDIQDSLKQLIARKPDVILIELTGVANPEEIVDALTEPALLPHVKLHSTITVLDAEHVLDYNSIFASDRELVHTLRKQIEVADLLLLNKIDLISDKQLKSIEKTVRKFNSQALLLPTTFSQLDLEKLFGSLPPRQSQPRATPTLSKSINMRVVKAVQEPRTASKHTASFSRVQTLAISIGHDVVVTQSLVEHYLGKWGKSLLRAKGYLRIGTKREAFLLQFAGKRTTWQPAAYQEAPYLVLIGLDLDVQLLEDDWTKRLNDSQTR